MNELRIELVNLDSLVPYPNNPKLHPKMQVDLIAGSIQEFGFLVPLVVDGQNQIIAGHGRYEAARKLGMGEVPVIRAGHLSKAQIKAFRLADNKVGESGWDLGALEIELEELSELEFDPVRIGFDPILPADFAPGTEEDQGRLDQKAPVTCPECGHVFQV